MKPPCQEELAQPEAALQPVVEVDDDDDQVEEPPQKLLEKMKALNISREFCQSVPPALLPEADAVEKQDKQPMPNMICMSEIAAWTSYGIALPIQTVEASLIMYRLLLFMTDQCSYFKEKLMNPTVQHLFARMAQKAPDATRSLYLRY